MKRRDFLAGVPAALAEPAYGSDWQEMYVGDYWDFDTIDVDECRQLAVEAFRRRMKADNLTEIRNFREEITWNPKRRQHFFLATASVR